MPHRTERKYKPMHNPEYKPSMLQELRYPEMRRSPAWYKYQYYKPADGRADEFGFVHFESKKEFDAYKRAEREFKHGQVKAPSRLEWFLLGMAWAGLIATLIWAYFRG